MAPALVRLLELSCSERAGDRNSGGTSSLTPAILL